MYIRRSVLLEKKHVFEMNRETHQIIKYVGGRSAVGNNITSLNLTGNNQTC